jgi:protein-L-isoaspartate(D-aspartate) O-methyltransferase
MPNFSAQRFNMVASQVLAGGVIDEGICTAMRQVERERFVPAVKQVIAYAETPIELVPGRYLMDARTFGLLLQAADATTTDKVLDVGCGTGYSTAVLSELAGRVIGLEQDADLVRIATELLRPLNGKKVTVVQGSLAEGHRAEAPYDVILINGGIETQPRALLSQLAEGGRLVAVVGSATEQRAIVFLNEKGHIGRRVVFDAHLPTLAGFKQPTGFVF